MKLPFASFGEGKPLILVHAFPLSGNMWKGQAQMLAENGYRVIVPDLPGFGVSAWSPHRYSIVDMAAQISDLLDSLKIRKSIIGGLSMGGYILFNLFQLAPEKISALIFCDTTFAADTDEKRHSRFELISKIEDQGSVALVENMLPNLISEYTKQNNPSLTEKLKENFLEVAPRAAINALQSMAERNDNSEILDKIKIPTLLIFGEFDKITKLENAQIMKRLIPKSEFVVIEKAGHYSNLEQPEQFNKALLDFCNRIEL